MTLTSDAGSFRFDKRIRRVAVIGAGASGLPCVRHLTEAGLEVCCYERQSIPGGIWNWVAKPGRPLAIPSPAPSKAAFTPRTPDLPNGATKTLITDDVEVEKDLARPPNPVYWSLSNNVPTTTMAFKDHPYPPGTPENIRHEEIARYMHSYAAQFDLSEKISFETRVESAEKVGDEWKLVVRRVSEVPHGLEEIFSTEVFDALVVATGHYNAPYIPPIPGLEAWAAAYPDRILHTQNYRSPTSYAGGRVLIVGTGTSAIDISRDMAPHVSELYFSAREFASAPPGYLQMRNGQRQWLPIGSRLVPAIKRFVPPSPGRPMTSGTIELEGGESLTNITHVLFATGFIYSYPFMPQLHRDPGVIKSTSEDRLLVTTGDSVRNLFRDVFYIPDPTLAFLGLSVNTSTFSFFEYQSIAIARVFSQTAWLPSSEDMRASFEAQASTFGAHSKHLHFLGKEGERRYVRETVEWINKDAARAGATPITGHSESWLAASDRVFETVRARMKPVAVGQALLSEEQGDGDLLAVSVQHRPVETVQGVA